MIVSHDRAFLAATATDIVEFSNQSLRQYAMNFDTYIESKRARAAKMEKEVENLGKKRQHAMDVANKLEKAAAGTANCDIYPDFFRIFLLKMQAEWRIAPEK